ncbi:MAG: hypothetical protein V3T83_09155 [Acidobacteriota bacterium]
MSDVPVFFGARGWTFERPGAYSIDATYRDPQQRFEVDAEALRITVSEGGGVGRQLLADSESAGEAGRFLVWQGGDHLRKGIATLKDLVADHPLSPLAAHSRVALGISFSRDFIDYTLGRVRRSECWSTRYFLEGAPLDRLPETIRLRKNLAEAGCRLRSGDHEAARRMVREAARTAQRRTDLRVLFDGLVELYSLPR